MRVLVQLLIGLIGVVAWTAGFAGVMDYLLPGLSLESIPVAPFVVIPMWWITILPLVLAWVLIRRATSAHGAAALLAVVAARLLSSLVILTLFQLFAGGPITGIGGLVTDPFLYFEWLAEWFQRLGPVTALATYAAIALFLAVPQSLIEAPVLAALLRVRGVGFLALLTAINLAAGVVGLAVGLGIGMGLR